LYQYRLEGVAKVFAQRQVAVSDISLDVESGERVALIGPSGAGKTTLFRMLNCTLRPSSGQLWINGDETGNLYGSRLREVRRKIGTIYQQHNLIPRFMQKTLMVNLHSIDLALSNFPRIIGIKNGRALFDLSPDQVSDNLLEELYSGHLPDNGQEESPARRHTLRVCS